MMDGHGTSMAIKKYVVREVCEDLHCHGSLEEVKLYKYLQG